MTRRFDLMRATCLLALAMLTACDRRSDSGPVAVSVIGPGLSLADSSRAPLAATQRLMLDATAEGLVRFDAAGQIEPGIAERWTVIDNGMSYIFRLREATWPNGTPVKATDVVTILRRQLGASSRNTLKPFLSAIDEIIEMTPEVIEVRLNHPRPDLLKLFAQPELAVFRLNPQGGAGPFRIASNRHNHVLLRPAPDPSRSPDDDARSLGPQDDVDLIGERASRAIVRFADHDSDLVTGGTFIDWPLLAASDTAQANRRVDPAAGLFGFAVVDRTGFLADAANRAAVARAIDRGAVLGAFTNNWTPVTQILPDQLDSAAAPTPAPWASAGILPRDAVRAWQGARPGPVALRVAVPAGPGATLLYGEVGASLILAGFAPERVAQNAPADLRLIDAVAPYDSARWYLAVACQLCSADVEQTLEYARDADTLVLRGKYLAQADAALAADVAFIPLARPLRWSLVSLRLKGWQGNPRAWHPLNRLRSDTN
ncbi:MAG: ABC transporter substrate-binding protein [Pseudomonadota bacterium]|nr:ABC transporter substrate-binding protein [Pseudomonadota bacterium]